MYEQLNMIDIHTHLVPGVDDGAADWNMVVSMVLQAQSQGIGAIFTTPHSSAFDLQLLETRMQFRQLRNQMRSLFPDLPIYLGCEVYCEAGHMQEVTHALRYGKYPTMNGTSYVLTEFSKWIRPDDTGICVEALLDAGYLPIIAHVERYAYLRGDKKQIDTLLEMGCLLQANVYSFFDEMEEPVKCWAQQLAKEEKLSFLGTDTHNSYDRPPCAKRGLDWLYANCRKEYVDEMVWGNARKLLIRQ